MADSESATPGNGPSESVPQPHEQTATNKRKSLLRHLCSDIRLDVLAETELLFLTFTTGIADALTFPDYHCFASNQTGNTVLLAVSITGLGTYDLFIPENVGVSLACFILGGLLTGQAGHRLGPRRRLWVFANNAFQTALVYVAAALQYRYGSERQGPYALTVVSLLSLASGSQVVLSRALACPEISTAMATAAWVDLLVDPHLLMRRNRGRNRRMAFLVTLFLGSLTGAFMYTKVSSPFALLMSAVGKTVVTAMFLFNESDESCRRKEKRKDEESAMSPAHPAAT